MASDKVKRALIWLRTAFRITDKTTLPGEILGEIRPTVDVFGWDRRNPQSSGPGAGPVVLAITGLPVSDILVSPAVPEGVMRYIIYASMSHNDSAGLVLSMQVRTPGNVDVAINAPPGGSNFTIPEQPYRVGLERSILLEPGESLMVRSIPPPAIGLTLFLTQKFVDIDPGEYMPPL